MVVVICDGCNQQVVSGQHWSVGVGADHGMVRVFDIGPCCIDKPFRVPPSARVLPRGVVLGRREEPCMRPGMPPPGH